MKRIVMALSLILASCVTPLDKGVTLPPLPKWQAPKGRTDIPASEVANEVRNRVATAIINYSDLTYSVVNAEWLDQFLLWTWRAAREAGVTYTAESFDCEDFAGLFNGIVSLAAAQAGVKASPLVARVLVQLDPKNRHELVGVVTDRGVFIIEPQPDARERKWKLEAYPKEILAITFGSYNRPY